MWRHVIEAFRRHDQRMASRTERISNPTTDRDFFLGFLMLGGIWALAWYAHIVFPWIESVLGWAPSTPDSEGKIQWRRVWSSAFCLFGFVSLLVLYIRHLRRRRIQS